MNINNSNENKLKNKIKSSKSVKSSKLKKSFNSSNLKKSTKSKSKSKSKSKKPTIITKKSLNKLANNNNINSLKLNNIVSTDKIKNIELKINKKQSKNIIPIEDYKLTNKKDFLEWFNKTFLKYRATGKDEEKSTTFKPYNYQKLLRNFMDTNSPYKGILLYHGLGSGKTCTSITIAENLKDDKNIIVMLPASLKNNFIYKGVLFCGDPEYKIDQEKYKSKYTFVSYNSAYLLN